jgi:hypothetical protein
LERPAVGFFAAAFFGAAAFGAARFGADVFADVVGAVFAAAPFVEALGPLTLGADATAPSSVESAEVGPPSREVVGATVWSVGSLGIQASAAITPPISPARIPTARSVVPWPTRKRRRAGGS